MRIKEVFPRLDMFWRRDESLEESDNLQLGGSRFNVQSPMLGAQEIVAGLEEWFRGCV